MSNVLAIATVTQTIVQILGDALAAAHMTGAHVTAFSPDSKTLPEHGVNVFLYQVSPNPALRNSDLPTRRADGTLLQRPRAALDLSYLITFYGDDTRLERLALLGTVARALHAQPVLPRATIQFVQNNVPYLSGADLADQPELVRVTPINFTLEELSKLWSFLLKTDYVLSVAYQANLVLIETDDPVPSPALPVLSANIYSLPFRQPVIETIAPVGGAPFILSDGQIALPGRNFVLRQSTSGGLVTVPTYVLIGGQSLVPTTLDGTDITVTLPAGLAAGTQAVQVIQSLLLGTPPVPHQQGVQSSVVPFVLHPEIRQSSPGVYEIIVQHGIVSPPGDAILVTVTPTVKAGQRGLLELYATAAPSVAHLFDASTIAVDTNVLTFDIPALAPGNYLVRIRVDGAESPMEVDVHGTPVAPVITL